MFKNHLILTVYCFCSLILLSFSAAQNASNLSRFKFENADFSNSESKLLVSAYVDVVGNSSTVTNSFINALLGSSFINDGNKDDVSKRLKSSNRLGFDAEEGILTKIKLGDNKPILSIGLSNRDLIGAVFNKDLFELYLRGNKPFAGKLANLGSTSFQYYNYQQITFGLEKKTGQWLFGGTLGLVKGGRLQAASLKKADLFTASDGSYITFDVDADISYAGNTSQSRVLTVNGAGASIAGKAMYTTENNKHQFAIELKDLGFINWNNTTNYSKDSTYRFEGIVITDVFQINDSLFSDLKTDSITSILNIEAQKKSKNTLLPVNVHFRYSYQATDKWNIIGGLHYMYFKGYLPKIYGGANYQLGSTGINATASLGGFGRADFEIGATQRIKDKFLATINFLYLENLLAPKKTSGQGINVGLSMRF